MNKLKVAMNEFQKLAVHATKGGVNPHFKSTYSSLEDVIAALEPAAQLGLIYTQSIGFSDTHTWVKTVISHVDDDAVIESTVPVIVRDATSAQALGAGITYAKRYGLQSLFALPSYDDDGNAAEKAPEVKVTGNVKKIADSKDKTKTVEEQLKSGGIKDGQTNEIALGKALQPKK